MHIVYLALALLLVAGPVNAGSKYLMGSPDLSVSMASDRELVPGEDTDLVLIIENAGMNEVKISQNAIANRDDEPNTAKLVTIALEPGSTPFTVKTDPQMIGDIPGGARMEVPFHIKVKNDAPSGNYQVPVNISYTTLLSVDQNGVDSLLYSYRRVSQTLMLPVTLTGSVRLLALSVSPDQVSAGNYGYISVTAMNAGYETGKNTVLTIHRHGESPVIPAEGSVFIGDFPPGAIVQSRFKINADRSAGGAYYPLDLAAEYTDEHGFSKSSEPVTIGVPVQAKTDFTTVSGPSEMFAGDRRQIEVVFENRGGSPAYGAQARISAVDPFSSPGDISYLGDLSPGRKAVAQFELVVEKGATSKEYGLDAEIRYKDGLNNSHISDPMKVRVSVVPRTGINAVISNPILMSIIIAILIGIAYYLFIHRRGAHKIDHSGQE
jgi:hypothetical protein